MLRHVGGRPLTHAGRRGVALPRRLPSVSTLGTTPTAAVVASCSSSSCGLHSALYTATRGIRTVIPPRPAVTTLVYIDEAGRAARRGEQTDISLIRTRENKFYLQRVLPDGEVVRWEAPGLEYLKNVTNFETYSLNEIDEHGGIIIPADVAPSAGPEPPLFIDAVHYIAGVSATKKFTRKDRRHWHRRLFAHWKESPDKYLNHVMGSYGVVFLVVLWLVIRGFHSIKNNKPFLDANVYGITDEDRNRNDPFLRLKRFSDRHPEHESLDMTMTMLSPGQGWLSSARAELRESDFTDPHFHSEFWWKVRHLRYYGHWPKGLAD